MLTRRELVTGSAIGTLAVGRLPVDAAGPDAASDTPPQDIDNDALRRIAEAVGALRVNTVAYGFVPRLREAFTLHWKTYARFPEFCEVGTSVFYDIYDWHIRNGLPIPVGRSADGRVTIAFMFTQLLVRPDLTPDYLGVPYDPR